LVAASTNARPSSATKRGDRQTLTLERLQGVEHLDYGLGKVDRAWCFGYRKLFELSLDPRPAA
jgi:hypothetical protein